jgi:hypothetical protein
MNSFSIVKIEFPQLFFFKVKEQNVIFIFSKTKIFHQKNSLKQTTLNEDKKCHRCCFNRKHEENNNFKIK